MLNVLYNLFPGVPVLAPTSPADDTANAIAGDLSSALYTGLPYPLSSQQQQQQSPFPYLDGDFVVEEGLRLFPLVQPVGTDILEAHSALLLCCFAQAGLFEVEMRLSISYSLVTCYVFLDSIHFQTSICRYFGYILQLLEEIVQFFR